MVSKCTYSNDSLEDFLSFRKLIAINLVVLYTFGHVVEKRAEVSSLKKLIKCNELESYCGAITKRGGKRSTR